MILFLALQSLMCELPAIKIVMQVRFEEVIPSAATAKLDRQIKWLVNAEQGA